MDQITDQMLANKGVKGLPDTPGLTTTEMQTKLEEIARDILVPKVNEIITEFTKLMTRVITSNTDLMATTVAGYLPDALAVKQQFDDVNSKLQIPVFLSETSGTGQNVNIDSAQYRYLLINVIDGAYATHTILSPNVISSLAVLGIQSQIGLQTANGYAYLNFTLTNGVFTWSSDSSKTVDIYGIK